MNRYFYLAGISALALFAWLTWKDEPGGAELPARESVAGTEVSGLGKITDSNVRSGPEVVDGGDRVAAETDGSEDRSGHGLLGIGNVTTTPAPAGSAMVADRMPSPLEETTGEAEPTGEPMPFAIRLSDDFRLPAIVMTLSDGGLAGRPEPVRAAAKALADDFYRELAAEVAKAGDWEKDMVVEPETGERTVIVKPGPLAERVRRRTDERFRLLFGDDAYNAYLVRAGMERLSAIPVTK